MRLQHYFEEPRYELLANWVSDERTHALWSARRFDYPLTKDNFEASLQEFVEQYGDEPVFVYEEGDEPIGFCVYNINEMNHSAFLKFIVLNHEMRGRGYGTKMLRFVADTLFATGKVEAVSLNVFSVNEAAKGCYRKAGFVEQSGNRESFSYKEEIWERTRMTCKHK